MDMNLSPMIDMRPDAPFALLAVALIGLLVSVVWIRRIAAGDAASRSFRATTRRLRHAVVALGVTLGVAAALIVIAPLIASLNSRLTPAPVHRVAPRLLRQIGQILRCGAPGPSIPGDLAGIA